MRGVFITGTDTGVGKTVVTRCLARHFLEKGYNAITQKWIATGCHKSQIKAYFSYTSPYTFKQGCSPHLAAKLENKKIDAKKIIKSFKSLSSKFDFVLVEGIGGALVPFNKKSLVIDIAKKLDLPALVVVRNKLGAINHAVLTIEALRQRKIKILGIIFNNLNKEDKLILEDNPRIIKILTKENILGVLPRIKEFDKLYKKFIPIGNRLFKAIGKRWINGLRKT